jgi:hypothetical protein
MTKLMTLIKLEQHFTSLGYDKEKAALLAATSSSGFNDVNGDFIIRYRGSEIYRGSNPYSSIGSQNIVSAQ